MMTQNTRKTSRTVLYTDRLTLIITIIPCQICKNTIPSRYPVLIRQTGILANFCAKSFVAEPGAGAAGAATFRAASEPEPIFLLV